MGSGPRKPMSPPPPSTVAVVDYSSSIKTFSNSSLLLEFAACNDLSAVKRAVETESVGVIISAPAPWYCRSVGSSSSAAKMGFADRTPLMIAALYGSTDVLHYIIHCNPTVDHINRRSEFDGATALHLAAAGGSPVSLETVKILINAGADVDAVDSSGRRPGDVVAKQTVKVLEGFLKPAAASAAADCSRASSPETPKESKKEYPPDLTLPDINNGIYGTDEFRMYSFKVRPCSRAYSHDWTECPFVHPGENARRRDPRKYLYSCVSCPEFRKGSCRNGDNCEYAHGVFESWLHPAQYRTRLCKDETGCNRRVCFFAHKHEELRFVNPTAASVNGLVVPSPRSAGVSNLDLAAAALMLSSSPVSPSAAAVSAGMGSPAVWMNQAPTLQLPSSRLKASMSARDSDVDFGLLGLEGYQQKLLDEIHSAAAAASPRSSWPSTTASRAADYSSLFGSQMVNQSRTQQLLSGYSNNLPSSPTLNSPSSFGLDHSMAKAIMNSRSAAFAKRSQSFIDQGAAARLPVAPATTAMGLSDWGSRDGRLDWGMQGEELNKFNKSASFAYRNNQAVSPPRAAVCDEPDLSWVHSLVKDGPSNAVPAARGGLGFDQQRKTQYQMNGSAGGDFLGADMFSPWGEEQMVA